MKQKGPNIVVVLGGQWRWDCAGFAHHPDARTPNLDAFARRAVVCAQATTQSPHAAPARGALLTGRAPGRLGCGAVSDNLDTLPLTLPGALRAAGYRTAAIGKTAITAPAPHHGFETFQRAECGAEAWSDDEHHLWLCEQEMLPPRAEGRALPYPDPLNARFPLPESAHVVSWIGDRAVHFVQQTFEPFFLFVSFPRPGAPFDPPPPWRTMYRADALRAPEGATPPEGMTPAAFRKALAAYYAAISHMDRQIGRILATLTSRGMTRNVLVVSADRGEYLGARGRLGRGPGPMHDAILRVPLVLAGFRGQRRGVRDDALVELTDLAPTLLTEAGLQRGGMDGQDLGPWLRGEAALAREAAYAELDADTRAVRSQRFKLIQSPHPALRGFHDLDHDPTESENCYGRPSHAEAQDAMARLLDQRTSPETGS